MLRKSEPCLAESIALVKFHASQLHFEIEKKNSENVNMQYLLAFAPLVHDGHFWPQGELIFSLFVNGYM